MKPIDLLRPTRPCKCAICVRSGHIHKVQTRGTKAEMRKLIDDLHDSLTSVELDEDWCRAIIDGSWPDADEIIARARQKHSAEGRQ